MKPTMVFAVAPTTKIRFEISFTPTEIVNTIAISIAVIITFCKGDILDVNRTFSSVSLHGNIQSGESNITVTQLPNVAKCISKLL